MLRLFRNKRPSHLRVVTEEETLRAELKRANEEISRLWCLVDDLDEKLLEYEGGYAKRERRQNDNL